MRGQCGLAKEIPGLGVGVRDALSLIQCPGGSAWRYLPVVGSQSRIQFWWRPDSLWNHWPGNLAVGSVPVEVWTPPKG